MYNHSQIRTGLYGLVGFKDGLRTEFQIVDTANKATSSGMYFQDYHALVTIENLKNIALADLSDVEFNTWLADLVKGSAVKVVNTVMQKFRDKSKTVFDNLILYNYPSVIDTLYQASGNAFVGYEVELCHANNIMMVLDSIGLLFDGTDTFNLYVFHSSKQEPIYTVEVTPEANIEAWEAQTGKLLEYWTDTYVGGKFYVGYLQQDLTASPINREWDMANVADWSELFSIQPMTVNGHNSATLFDLDAIDYTSETYGLNFSLSIRNNVTKQILTQKSVFTNAFGMQVAVDILEKIANSVRINDIKKESRDLAFAELNSENGLRERLEKEIKTVHIDLAGLDRLTMPKKYRVKTYTAR